MENYFTTYDILLCSFLLTQDGIELIDTKEASSDHFIFSLSNPNKCKQFTKDYLNNSEAPARELFSNREMLIGEIKKHKLNILSQRAWPLQVC